MDYTISPQAHPLPVIEVALPRFVAIEDALPFWPEARRHAAEVVPAALGFFHHGGGIVRVADAWAGQLAGRYDAGEPGIETAIAAQTIWRHAAVALEFTCSAIPLRDFDRFISTVVHGETLARMTSRLHALDQARVFAGHPSFIQLLRHAIGLERAYARSLQ